MEPASQLAVGYALQAGRIRTGPRDSRRFPKEDAADWCVKPYDQANHAPIVKLTHALDLTVRPGQKVSLSAKGSADPDGDALTYRWWEYQEADTYEGAIDIVDAGKQDASFTVPGDGGKGKTIHVICEVTDNGTPSLTRYRRVVVEIE